MSESDPPSGQPSGQPNNLLHGVTLKAILEYLVEHRGWEDLAFHVPINCFSYEPSITSSLKFLRKVPWAREKVEALYVEDRLWDQENEARRRAEDDQPAEES